jgi:hypothetical protein
MGMVGITSVHAGLLADWEFNADDLSGSNVNATAGSAANIGGVLIADAIRVAGPFGAGRNRGLLRFGNDLSDVRGLGAMTLSSG